MIRADSQNARVLAVLADGLPHTASEIHRRAGFMRLNSRVAELRSKEGLEIVCEHIGGTGPDAYLYTLLPDGAEKTPGRGQSSESVLGAMSDASSGSSDKFGEEGCGEPDGGSRADASASALSSPIQLDLFVVAA